jgi:hypothetical protein
MEVEEVGLEERVSELVEEEGVSSLVKETRLELDEDDGWHPLKRRMAKVKPKTKEYRCGLFFGAKGFNIALYYIEY